MMEWKRMTKVKKIFNVAISCKINLQGNLAIISMYKIITYCIG